MNEIFFIRHGKSIRGIKDDLGDPSYIEHEYWGRRADLPLDIRKISDLHLLKRKREENRICFGPIFSSHAIRCGDTARYIFGKDPTFLDLEPYSSGKLEKTKIEEVEKMFPSYYLESPFLRTPNGEESISKQIQRISPVLYDLLQKEEERITLITHCSVINIMYHILNNIFSPEEILKNIIEIPYGGLLILKKKEEGSWSFDNFLQMTSQK